MEHEGQGRVTDDLYTSANTGTGSKSYQFLTGLIGRDPQVGERFEDPTGTRVLVQIISNKKGFPKWMLCCPSQSHSRFCLECQGRLTMGRGARSLSSPAHLT